MNEYYYKGKPYKILHICKIKLEGKWQDCVVYECLYPNLEGKIWTRLHYDFFSKFKHKNEYKG